jgi:hypothetical protein
MEPDSVSFTVVPSFSSASAPAPSDSEVVLSSVNAFGSTASESSVAGVSLATATALFAVPAGGWAMMSSQGGAAASKQKGETKAGRFGLPLPSADGGSAFGAVNEDNGGSFERFQRSSASWNLFGAVASGESNFKTATVTATNAQVKSEPDRMLAMGGAASVLGQLALPVFQPFVSPHTPPSNQNTMAFSFTPLKTFRPTVHTLPPPRTRADSDVAAVKMQCLVDSFLPPSRLLSLPDALVAIILGSFLVDADAIYVALSSHRSFQQLQRRPFQNLIGLTAALQMTDRQRRSSYAVGIPAKVRVDSLDEYLLIDRIPSCVHMIHISKKTLDMLLSQPVSKFTAVGDMTSTSAIAATTAAAAAAASKTGALFPPSIHIPDCIQQIHIERLQTDERGSMYLSLWLQKLQVPQRLRSLNILGVTLVPFPFFVLPESLMELHMGGYRLENFPSCWPSQLQILHLCTDVPFLNLPPLPPSLIEIIPNSNHLCGNLSGDILPSGLKTLDWSRSRFLSKLPNNDFVFLRALTSLRLDRWAPSAGLSGKVCFPSGLKELNIRSHEHSEELNLPNSITILEMHVRCVDRIRWPTNLHTLILHGSDEEKTIDAAPKAAASTIKNARGQWNGQMSFLDWPIAAAPVSAPVTWIAYEDRRKEEPKKRSLHCWNPPMSLTSLTLPDEWNRSLDELILPTSLHSLTFGGEFNQPLLEDFTFPISLTYLSFGYRFNQPLVVRTAAAAAAPTADGTDALLTPNSSANNNRLLLPSSLKCLKFGADFALTLSELTTVLPPRLIDLDCRHCSHQALQAKVSLCSLHLLPSSLRYLHLWMGRVRNGPFELPLSDPSSIPNTLREIHLNFKGNGHPRKEVREWADACLPHTCAIRLN